MNTSGDNASQPEATSSMLTETRPCIRCSYELQGLPANGICPECGLPIERSLRGDLLQYSDVDYRSSLARGVTFIMAGLICYLIVLVGGLLLGLSGVSKSQVLLTILGFGASIVSLYGYYQFSVADPGQLTSNRGETPRRVLRTAIAIVAITSVLNIVLTFLSGNTRMNFGRSGSFDSADMVNLLASLIGAIAGAVQFFAAMLYTRWLAPRLPDERIFKRAKLLMWLGPVLFVFGCGIGQLVAIVLYYNMFSWIRQRLREIQTHGNVSTAAPA